VLPLPILTALPLHQIVLIPALLPLPPPFLFFALLTTVTHHAPPLRHMLNYTRII
jgi:hypothetical protein